MKHWVLFICIISMHLIAKGQDILGGEMSVIGLTSKYIQCHIIIYTSTESITEITLDWGDGTDTILHDEGGVPLCDFLVNEFLGYHTYAAEGTYRISLHEEYLVDNIANIENSEFAYFDLADTVVLDTVLGLNSSPVFGTTPCQIIYEEGIYQHYLNVYDPDGDSLVYSICPFPALGFSYPAASDELYITSEGILTWDMPQEAGLYSLGLKVTQYRGGYFIGTATRAIAFIVDSIEYTSIAPFESSNSKIFPNPSGEYFIFQMGDPIDPGKIVLVSTFGQKVPFIVIGRNKNQFVVDISKLSSGIYYMNYETYVAKIIKL